MRKVSDHMRLVKREAGANPARTRHRDSQATAYYHWETGKGVEASERSVGRPAFRSTGMKSYRSPASSTLSAASQLIFAYKKVRVNGNNENSCHEKLAVRNLQNQKHFWFYFVALRDSKLWLYGVDSAIQLCTFRLSSLFSTASERKFPVSLIYRHIHTLLGQNFIVL